jgi:hypothetical protein
MKNRTVRRTNRRRQRKSRYTYEGGAEMGEKPEMMGGMTWANWNAMNEAGRLAAGPRPTITLEEFNALTPEEQAKYGPAPIAGGRYRRKSRRNRRRSNRRH